MAHSIFVTTLQTAARAARAAGNPLQFLNQLESGHANWHGRTFGARALGFLTFHWTVIKYFRSAGCPTLWSGGVRPFREVDFAGFGWPYDVTARAANGNFQSLADFSRAIETWHNEAHMAVGMAFNIANDMMDPRVNIYYREFWRLHYFINGRYLAELRRYDAKGGPVAKIERLEATHHARLNEV